MPQFRSNKCISYQTNAFLQNTQPWDLVKGVRNAETQKKLDQIIFVAAEAIRIAAILLQPFMPAKMERLLDMLGVRPEARSFEFAELGKDFAYGESKVDLGRGHVGVLFPPLTSAA